MTPPPGLVLSGGFLRGAFQVRVIEALRGRGIRFDVVVGVSSGAWNAACMATEQIEEMRAFWLEVARAPKLRLRNLWRHGTPSNFPEIVHRIPMRRLRFEPLAESGIRLRVGALALRERRLHLFDRWDSREAFLACLMASSYLPGVYVRPLRIDGRQHADGGLVDNVPYEAAFVETSLEDQEWIARIDLFGVILGCHFFVPEMVRRGRGGYVVNVASAAAYAPLPAQSAYAATKFAVAGFSEFLRAKLALFGIGVTALCPGFIDTFIVERSRLRGVAADPENRRRTPAFYRRRGYRPERVARNLLKAVQRGRALAPISAEAWLLYYASRIAPGLLRWVNGKLAGRILAGP